MAAMSLVIDVLTTSKTWDKCYDLKNIFAQRIGEKNGEKMAKKWRFFIKLLQVFAKN
jgi:hypothetical protein